MEFLTITAAVCVGTLLKEVAIAVYATRAARKVRSKRYEQLVGMRNAYAAQLGAEAKASASLDGETKS